MKKPKISILIPTYNGELYIKATLASVFAQDFEDFEIVISDDHSTDKTLSLVRRLHKKNIRIYQNRENLGYPLNLERGRRLCRGEILFLLAQDDLLRAGALSDTYHAFNLSQDIGGVTRPYYWFDKSSARPVRAKKQLNGLQDEVVTINDSEDRVIRVVDTLDQLSGLAFRVKFMKQGFHPDVFTCHIYPFLSIFKEHPVVFLKDYETAVRIKSSQSRSAGVYLKSPILSWQQMIKTVFAHPKYTEVCDYLISDFVAKNYLGLIQIRNFSTLKNVLREVGYLVRFRPRNLIEPLFWLFSLVSILMPPSLLLPIADCYKAQINSKILRSVRSIER